MYALTSVQKAEMRKLTANNGFDLINVIRPENHAVMHGYMGKKKMEIIVRPDGTQTEPREINGKKK